MTVGIVEIPDSVDGVYHGGLNSSYVLELGKSLEKQSIDAKALIWLAEKTIFFNFSTADGHVLQAYRLQSKLKTKNEVVVFCAGEYLFPR